MIELDEEDVKLYSSEILNFLKTKLGILNPAASLDFRLSQSFKVP